MFSNVSPVVVTTLLSLSVGFPTQLVKLSTLGCKGELAGKLTKLSYKTAKEIISGTPKPPYTTFLL